MILNYRTAIVVALVCGAFLSVVSTISIFGSKIPEQSDLAAVAGRVSSVETITPQTENIAFQLDSSPSTFKYTESLPNFGTVRSGVALGRRITVYVDKASVAEAGGVMVWGIQTQGSSWLVTYEALTEYRKGIGGQVSSRNRIGLGLIGCGGRMGLGIQYGILNNLCGPDEEIVCMAEPDPSHWDKIRAVVRHHQPTTDSSKIPAFYYREMLEKRGGEIDAVVIATPNHHHAAAAILAMSKGLHVYVEKPMALTIEEVRLMRAAQKKSGVATQVGNHGHSDEGMRRLVE